MDPGEVAYEEVRKDGTATILVLAIRDSEWDKRTKDPLHIVATRWVRNPRQIEQERVDAELEASIWKLGIDEDLQIYGKSVSHVLALTQAFEKMSPKDQNRYRPELPQYRAACSHAINDASSFASSSKYASATAGSAHRPVTFSPHQPGIENADFSAPRPQRMGPSPNGYAKLPTTGTSLAAEKLWPPEICQLAFDISIAKRVAGGIPSRWDLRGAKFAEHFDSETGVLQASSPLRRYYGDQRMFSPKTWEWLVGGYFR